MRCIFADPQCRENVDLSHIHSVWIGKLTEWNKQEALQQKTFKLHVTNYKYIILCVWPMG